MVVSGWQYFTSKKQWEAYLKDLLRTNEVALLRAIVIIHNRQTTEEQATKTSTEDNNVGWTKTDAEEMGNLALKLKRGEKLTVGELAKSKNKMQKYWKQLMDVSKQQQAIRLETEPKALEQKGLQIELSERLVAEVDHFRKHNETLTQCSENGVTCEYGICDECIIKRGYQVRMQV